MCLQSHIRKTFRLFTARTSAGSLFHMFSTATLKARLPYAVRVRGTWTRGRCEERSDTEEPVKICQLGCWLYFYAKVASLKLIRWEVGTSVTRGWAWHDFWTTRARQWSFSLSWCLVEG